MEPERDVTLGTVEGVMPPRSAYGRTHADAVGVDALCEIVESLRDRLLAQPYRSDGYALTPTAMQEFDRITKDTEEPTP
jgi:hypothetical protein